MFRQFFWYIGQPRYWNLGNLTVLFNSENDGANENLSRLLDIDLNFRVEYLRWVPNYLNTY